MEIKIPFSVKYRPKKLADVIGQPVIVKAFTNAFKYKTLHHAYILGGMFGTGKTSLGRILSAMENCEKGRTLEPCGQCNNCKEIFSGKSFDTREIDAASGGKIDDIRALRKEVYQSPINSRVKYVIIDEAHSLSRDAAEAALKMIEEPPDKVRFVLCTTNPQALKDTIHSRCIMWKFNKVSWVELLEHLKNISNKEKIEYDEIALRIAAKTANGSVRNALQNLQTIINYVGDGKITGEDAKDALGAVDYTAYFDWMNSIIEENTVNSFTIINNILKDGKEIGIILNGMYNHLDNLMKVKVCKEKLEYLFFSEDEEKKYSYQSSKLLVTSILKMMNFMSEVNFGLEYNLDPQILLNKFTIQAILIQKSVKKK